MHPAAIVSRGVEGSQEGRGLGRRTVDVHVREGVVEEEGRVVLGVLVDEAHPIPGHDAEFSVVLRDADHVCGWLGVECFSSSGNRSVLPRKVHRQVAVIDRLLDEALPAVEEADGRVGRRQVDLLS